MKTYHDQMDSLSFTDTQKAAMTDRLLAAANAPAPRRRPVRRAAVAIAVAAALALSVTAGATGVLKPVGEAFAGLFGVRTPAQTEVIDHIGYPIGASDTDNGVTVTADAILVDRYSYAVVYSVVLSPLSLQVNYTVDSEVVWDHQALPDGRESAHDAQTYEDYFGSLPILVTLSDGSVLDLTYAGGSIEPAGGKTVCQKGEVFENILPLEDVVSVTVGDVTIPMP